jgi:hypothetical protein
VQLKLPAALVEADRFQSEPIVCFEIDEVIDPELFDRLNRTFPASKDARYEVHNVGTKKYLDNSQPQFWDFLQQAPEWRQLYEAFSSREMIDRLYWLTLPYLDHRRVDERRPWSISERAIRQPGFAAGAARRAHSFARAREARLRKRTPVYVGFEFSELTAADRIPPHTDVPSKLLSLMIYFPDGDDQSQLPLGTEFYRARPGFDTNTMWDSGMPDDSETGAFFEQHECYYQLPFTGNRLVGFVKTDHSWHGLRALPLPPGRTRRALVVNVFRR